MKKLTAGIFAAILTVVGVGAADANIASQAYVDQKDTAITTTVANTYATKSELSQGLGSKQDTLSFDDTPTAGSSNPVTSAGIYSALNATSGNVSGLSGKIGEVDYNTGTSIEATTVTGAIKELDADYKVADIALKESLDSTAAAATGSYVSGVTLTDGTVTVAETALPTVTDTAQANQYVSAVNQTSGKIAVTRAELNVAAVNGLQDALDAKLTGVRTDAIDGDTDPAAIPQASAVKDYVDTTVGEANNSVTELSGTVTAQGNRLTAAEEDIDELETSLATGGATANAIKAAADAAAAAQGTADTNAENITKLGTAVGTAATATSTQTAIDALETALTIPAACQATGASCVLKGDSTGLNWEIIQRGTDETATSAGTSVKTPNSTIGSVTLTTPAVAN